MLRISALLLLALSASAAASFVLPTGCTTRACEGGFLDTLDPATNKPAIGHMVDNDTWETNAIEEAWIDFPAERAYRFHIPAMVGRHITSIESYVSTDPSPNTTNFAEAAGNLSKLNFIDIRPGGPGDAFQIWNDTCTQLYLRVVVRAGQLPPDAGAPADSGTPDADAGLSDAGDAGPDAADATPE